MKKSWIICGAIIGTVLLFCTVNACKGEPKQDPQEVAEDQNELLSEEAEAAEEDSKYLVDAAATDLMEIKIGELAQQKGVHADVKNFGKMMVEEHHKSVTEVKNLAASKSITVPSIITEDGIEEFNTLNEKSGTDFDKKFAEMMVDGHQKALNQARKASEDAIDDEIRNWATGKVVTLTGHLEHAKALKETVNK